jgi:hypothetical protein
MTNPFANPSLQTWPASLGTFFSPVLGRLDQSNRSLDASIVPAAVELRLAKGGLHAVPQPLGQKICCTQGSLWLTFDNVPVDIVLEVGESHLCDLSSKLMVSALAPARFTIE